MKGLQHWPLWRGQELNCAGNRWSLAVAAGSNRPNTGHSWALSQAQVTSQQRYLRKVRMLWTVRLKKMQERPCKHQGQKRRRGKKLPKLQSSCSPVARGEDPTGAQSHIAVIAGSYARRGRYFLSGTVACGELFCPKVMQILAGLYHAWQCLFLHQLQKESKQWL